MTNSTDDLIERLRITWSETQTTAMVRLAQWAKERIEAADALVAKDKKIDELRLALTKTATEREFEAHLRRRAVEAFNNRALAKVWKLALALEMIRDAQFPRDDCYDECLAWVQGIAKVALTEDSKQ